MSKSLLKSEWEVLREQLKSEKNVLKALEEHFTVALEDVEIRIASMLGRKDANLPHVIRRIEYQQMVKAQVQAALDKLHANEYETIAEYLKESYTDAFVGSVYTLHQQGMPVIIPIDQSVVTKAVTIDSNLKTGLYKELGVDVNRLKKSIASEITRGIATNATYDEIARNIFFAAKAPLSRAKTIARTEAGRVQEQATFDAANEAKAAGADVVKQWSSFRDGKTRDSHRAMDGQVRELKEKFSNGLLHPKHPAGSAGEVINCRCTMLTRARSAMDEDELKLLEERAAKHKLLVKDAKGYEDAKAKDFADFKKKYLKAAEEEGQKSATVRKLMAKVAKGETLTNEEYAQAGREVRESVQEQIAANNKQINELIESLTKERESLDAEAFEALLSGDDSTGILKREGEIAKKIAELRSKLKTFDREAMKEELSKYRSIGFESSAEKEQFIEDQFDYGVGMGDFNKVRKREIMEAIAQACDYYPSEWLNKSVTYGKMSVERAGRAYYSHSPATIVLSNEETDDFETAIHEMAHRLEKAVPGLVAAEKAYYKSRTQNEPLVPLASLFKDSSFGNWEKTRVDGFVHAYMGKDYGDGNFFELCSMGFEYMYTKPDELAKDPDMYDWLVGLLLLK